MKTETLRGFLEATTISDRLDDSAVLEERMRRDPADPVALVQLENQYRSSGQWEALMTLHLTRAEHADDAELVACALREAAGCARILGDLDSAAMILQTAFARSPGDHTLANELEETAIEAGAIDIALDIFTVAAAQAAGELADDLWLRVACCHAILAEDPEAVEAALEHVPRDPGDRGLSILLETEARVQHRAASLIAFATVCDWVGEDDIRVRSLYRALSCETDRGVLAMVHCELGRALIDGGDADSAECHLGEAVRLCPESAQSRVALARVCAARGDRDRATDLLGEVDFAAAAPTSLTFEAAELLRELECHTQAVRLYNLTLEVDPGHTGAAIRLLRRYREQGRWDEAAALGGLVLQRLESHREGDFSRDEVLLLHAEALCHTGHLEDARTALEELIVADQRNVDALRLLAEVHHRSGELNLARATQNLVLRYRRRNAAPRSFVDDAFRLALLAREAGDTSAARRIFGDIRLAVPGHRPTLMQLAEMHREVEEYPEAISLLSEANVSSPSPAETARVYALMAYMTERNLGRIPAAMALYQRALAADPTCAAARGALIELLIRGGRWREAVSEMLEEAERATDHGGRFARLEQIREIIRRELGPRDAVALLNRALDCFWGESRPPQQHRAATLRLFTDIVTVLYGEDDLESLEKNYRHMIRRVGPDDPVQQQLWQDLGHLARRGQSSDASTTEREIPPVDSQVIDLYANAGQDELDKALRRRLRLIAEQPRAAEHYSALFDIATRLGQSMRVFAASRALEFLGAASDEQRLYFLRHRAGSQVQRSLAPQHFDRIRHPDHDPLISTIVSHVAGPILCARADQPAAFGLSAQGLQGFDPHREVYRRAAGLLGVRAPLLYVSATQRGGLGFVATTMGLALIAGPDLLPKQPDDASATRFLTALTLTRPSTVLRIALDDPAEVEAAFFAALCMARSKLNVPRRIADRVSDYRALLRRHLPTHDRARLIHTAGQLPVDRPYHVDAWWHAVAATARRAALLVHGNLQASARVVRREPVLAGGPSAEEKVQDLLLHSVSDEHVEARESLASLATAP